ncbi:nucleotidyltransferase domain-containing protein [Photobacterium aphoticum]|uniref:Oxalate:formate antiporter n=2 Tax=Photobacterium aphoticum TaxID=754436 RepID=A0A0J1GQY1_9GAMM|nr:nucleotidyltransferase domain-containing protein [Photobacterium aphoticum]KLV02051.1 oxalate:formate antiporter [Photobacterium aphoticum]PSU60299.1 oxalate:formate antiporter [Photobacterium aphoticum]GHA34724.1 oxalate:formate antiporter [Photobacterium aphoticum]
MNYPQSLPHSHKQLLSHILAVFTQDPRIVGIGASGSYASDTMDQYSDLDLVIAINPDDYAAVMEERFTLIEQLEGKVAAFTGEHVGEPRLVIALFAPHALHVDFKFVALPDAAVRVDDTKVVWERDGQLSAIYAQSTPHYPCPTPQWVEDRFWVWVHYAATKIARGEYFEAVEFLSFLRGMVLSPLALQQRGLTPSGVRHLEKRMPDVASLLTETIVQPEKAPLIMAFEKIIAFYLTLREREDVTIHHEAQALALAYFQHAFSVSEN